MKADKEAQEDSLAIEVNSLSPREIVTRLDEYIIGQSDAKRSVAIALRNRWRRQQVPPPLRDEIAPKNIIMIGPTGIGKTEIARRLAVLAQSPFVKVEASKFTEVGYVGRDVESMIRDLLELAIVMVRDEERKNVQGKAEHLVEEKLLDLLLPPPRHRSVAPTEGPKPGYPQLSQPAGVGETEPVSSMTPPGQQSADAHATREKFRRMLQDGKLEDREVEIDVEQSRPMPTMGVFPMSGMEEMESNVRDMFGRIFPPKISRRKMKVREAREILLNSEAEKLIDQEKVTRLAIKRTEQYGIVFLDEIDKIASKGSDHGPEVSRQGVQRDLLPVVEGATVSTKHGMVRTDHILFIASGAFHLNKPSDLIPELQGRFPIRVELKPLGADEFYRILTEPKNALLKQYAALMATEGVELSFDDEAIKELARLAEKVNARAENIGARRLHTILEKLLDELSFAAPERQGEQFIVTAEYVREQLAEVVANEDLSKFIL